MAGLPTLSSLWSNYPNGSSSSVKQMIGGNVNMGWVTNTCVIRMSHAFNRAGAPIPNGFPGLTTARGGNGKRYAFRVREFKAYLDTQYKPADITGASEGDFTGSPGIIMFDVEGWSDATGHFDMWDGGAIRYSAYFDKATKIYLWKCG